MSPFNYSSYKVYYNIYVFCHPRFMVRFKKLKVRYIFSELLYVFFCNIKGSYSLFLRFLYDFVINICEVSDKNNIISPCSEVSDYYIKGYHASYVSYVHSVIDGESAHIYSNLLPVYGYKLLKFSCQRVSHTKH